jgi:hypothetical protein
VSLETRVCLERHGFASTSMAFLFGEFHLTQAWHSAAMSGFLAVERREVTRLLQSCVDETEKSRHQICADGGSHWSRRTRKT